MTLPEIEIADDGEVFLVPDGQDSRKLEILHTPVPLSFISIPNNNKSQSIDSSRKDSKSKSNSNGNERAESHFIIADPTSAEEELKSAEWTIIYNTDHELCSFYKPGGAALEKKERKTCMKLAKVYAEQNRSLGAYFIYV